MHGLELVGTDDETVRTSHPIAIAQFWSVAAADVRVGVLHFARTATVEAPIAQVAAY